MDEAKPCLTFAFSNSTLLAIDKKQRVHWDHGASESKELKEWVRRYDGIYEIMSALPKDPRLYIGKYFGRDHLEIYRAEQPGQPNSDCPNRIIMRSVHYNPFASSKTLRASIISYDKQVICGSPIKKEPWDVFHKWVWLEDLYSAIPSGSETINDQNRRSFINNNPFLGGMVKMPLADWPGEIMAFQKKISTDPDLLRYPEVLNEYIEHKKCARGDYGKEKAKRMRELLEDYSIQRPEQYKGRRSPIPCDERVVLAYDLMKKLTMNLHGTCKDMFRKWGYVNEEDFKRFTDNKKEFEDFQSECRDPRLRVVGGPAMIKCLVFSPIERFLNPQVAEFFDCGTGTLKKHIKRLKTASN